jgi:hypothetical protein
LRWVSALFSGGPASLTTRLSASASPPSRHLTGAIEHPQHLLGINTAQSSLLNPLFSTLLGAMST